MTTSNPALKETLLAAGYTMVRNEGFTLYSRPYRLLTPFGRMATRAGAPTTSWVEATDTAIDRPLAETFDTQPNNSTGWYPKWTQGGTNFIGGVLKAELPGTIPLKTYFSSSRQEYLLCAATCLSSEPSGYTYVQTEGYVFQSYNTGLSFRRCYRTTELNTGAIVRDNYTSTTGSCGSADDIGFEGYALPLASNR